jgi:sugar lactone lactonase YvrE/DNA-directed RNA polymerase subunit RPC12/RpoP
MSNNPQDSSIMKTLQCPTCGTPLAIGSEASIKCPSCGNTVLVPAKYRPAQPQPPQFIFQQPVMPTFDMPNVDQMVRRSQRMGLIITIVILVFTFGIVGFSLLATSSATQSFTSDIQNTIGNITGSLPNVSVPSISKVPTAVPLASTTLQFGSKGSGAGQFDDSRSIAVDKDGNIYVADYQDGRVQKFDAAGKFQLLINVPEDKNGNNIIRGLAVDFQGTLYVSRGGDILKFSAADGSPQKTIAGHFPDTYYDALVVDAANVLYAMHSSAAQDDLLKLDVNGKLLARYKKIVSSVNKKDPAINLAPIVDGAGNIYLVSTIGDQVYLFDKTGKFTNRFGDSGNQPGQLDHPGPGAIDGQNRLYIYNSGRIDRFSTGGRYLDSQSIGYSQGVPMGMAIDLNGDVYVVTNNGVVSKYHFNQ